MSSNWWFAGKNNESIFEINNNEKKENNDDCGFNIDKEPLKRKRKYNNVNNFIKSLFISGTSPNFSKNKNLKLKPKF